jgi:hypothetical protein
LYTVVVDHLVSKEPIRLYEYTHRLDALEMIKHLTRPTPDQLTQFLKGKTSLTSPNGEVIVKELFPGTKQEARASL